MTPFPASALAQEEVKDEFTGSCHCWWSQALESRKPGGQRTAGHVMRSSENVLKIKAVSSSGWLA